MKQKNSALIRSRRESINHNRKLIKGNTADTQKIIPAFSEAALFIAAITGIFYLIGFMNKAFTLSAYGLTQNAIVESAQDTTASGATIAFLFSPIAGLMILMIISVNYIKLEVKGKFDRRLSFRQKFKISINDFRKQALRHIAVVGFCFGFSAGGWGSIVTLNQVKSYTENGCQECVIYQTRSEQIRAVLIASDVNRLWIVGADGLRTLKTEEIVRIHVPNRRMEDRAWPLSLLW